MLPLEGVRILAVESYGAGPFGSMQLADLGADVIKIENFNSGGDMSRQVGPYFDEAGVSLFYQSFNRNKKSLALDLKHPEGRAVFRKLAAGADAVYDNLRGDLPEKLGLTYAALKDENAAIVCAHLSAYGRDGERAHWPGYDYLMQAETGWTAVTGEPDNPPTRSGLSVVDMMAGVTAAFAVTAGILQARTTGIGRDLDVSLFDTALSTVSYLGVWYLNAGHNQQRVPRSGHPSLGPTGLFKTGDGWIFLMCQQQKYWPILLRHLGLEPLENDPRFIDPPARNENRAALIDVLDNALQTRSTAAWIESFAGTVPVAPVLDVAEALENSFVHERRRILATKTQDGCDLKTLAGAVTLAENATEAAPSPKLGEHSDEILRANGFSAAEIDALRSAGAIA